MGQKKLDLEAYLLNDDLFFDFSLIYDLGKPFTANEKMKRNKVAEFFSRSFNEVASKRKVLAFRRKIVASGLSKALRRFGKIGALKDVFDFTGTIDPRIPRSSNISHQVICLVFEKKSIFLKASHRNRFEEEYQAYARRFGLPSVKVLIVPTGGSSQIVLSEGVRTSIPLAKARTFSVEQLGMHAALADFLRKGGRNTENYLVSGLDVYAIDNEFLHNKRDFFDNDLRKGYHELFALRLPSANLASAIDGLYRFCSGYLQVAGVLNISRRRLHDALAHFLSRESVTKLLAGRDRENLIGIMLLKNIAKAIPSLSRLVGKTSPVLRKALRQSTCLTEKLFGFTPIRSVSNNFDSKTLVLREVLMKEMDGKKKILEIGPGCNATLAQYIKKNWPSVTVDAVELNTDFISNARKSVRANHLKISVKKGDIVHGIREKYDMIFWNIPAVSSNKAVLRKASGKLFRSVERFATESDDGTGLIKRFLAEAPGSLLPDGILIFASNTAYVPESKIRSSIKSSKLRLIKAFRQRNNTSRAYVLARRLS